MAGVISRSVGVVGLGKMGGPIAYSLYKKGLLAGVYARTTAPEFLKAYGLTNEDVFVAPTKRELGKRIRIGLLLVPINAVEEVIFGEDGIARAMGSGSTLIDCGNSDWRNDERFYRELKRRGIDFLDCAVSGGPKRARAGELVGIIGGDERTVEDCMGVFGSFCRKDSVFHMGPVGRGHEAKMYHNQDEQCDMRNIGETISVLLALGKSYSESVKALNSGLSRARLLDYAAMVPDDVLPRIAPKIGGGDLPQIAVETARSAGRVSPLTELMLNIRRISRGERKVEEAVEEARRDFARRHDGILKVYSFLREKVDPWKIAGDGELATARRALSLGYLIDLAEVFSIALARKNDIGKLAQVHRAGLCDKDALSAFMRDGIEVELEEASAEFPEEDAELLEEALELARKAGHPAPSAAAYLDVLRPGQRCAAELAKLGRPEQFARYGNAIRVQAGIRDAFGEHGFELEKAVAAR